MLALGAIAIGFLFIIFSDPPRTVCDSQLEIFRGAQKTFLYDRPAPNGLVKPAEFKALHRSCQSTNAPGGCFEYFMQLKKLLADLRNIPLTCSEAAAQETQIRGPLFQSVKLMAQIAWGDQGPQSLTIKHSWFDSADVALFCELQGAAIRLVGQDAYKGWRTGVMASLPGGDKMDQDQIWQKSIFSTACESFR